MQLQKRRNDKPRWGRGAMLTKPLTISTDRLVACPTCGEPMRLSEMQTFECRACGRAVTGEEALTALEQDGS